MPNKSLDNLVQAQRDANGRADFDLYKKQLRAAMSVDEIEHLAMSFYYKYNLTPKQKDFVLILKKQRMRELLYGYKSKYWS